MLVDILVFDGLDEMDAWGPAEVFRSAGKRGADIRTRLVTRLPLLVQARRSTPLVAGVCTGTMLLAHAGIVGSRRASTHHTALDDLQALGATLVRDRVVDDGDLVTSGGVTSGIDLALWLLEREVSRELADAVADGMEYHRIRAAGIE